MGCGLAARLTFFVRTGTSVPLLDIDGAVFHILLEAAGFQKISESKDLVCMLINRNVMLAKTLLNIPVPHKVNR